MGKIRVGITMGDPSGIGPEVVAKALHKVSGLADFVVIGDWWVIEQSYKSLPGRQAGKVISQKCEFIDLNNVSRKNFKFGKVKAEYGRAAAQYLDKAIELIKKEEIDCLVTAPISKEAVNLAGVSGFTGHTEYLAAYFKVKDPVMMLLNKYFKFSLVTTHVALKDVSSQLSSNKIYRTAGVTYQSLKDLFSIKCPRVVVCGLNPHASDNGLIGKEEGEVIKAAISRLKKSMPTFSGPVAADTAILGAMQGKSDAVIAMYHDQALVPLKLTDRFSGVNITLGLPFVRTSPLHGTAFDIAGKNIANPNSMIEAIRLAVKCTPNLKKA